MTTRPNSTFIPSPLRRIFCSLFFVAAAVAALEAFTSSRAVGGGGTPVQNTIPVAKKIAPWVVEHTANGQQAEFLVVLADQADLSPAAALQTKAEKGRFVLDALLNKAQTTQGPMLQWLRERGIEHQSFYIVNGILVKGSREIAEALASRPDVARVEGNPVIHNPLPQPVEGPVQPQAPLTIEPGISYTHAPDVWALGFTGQNIVVASADTGVRWTHNALKPHYRGWDGVAANHDYNWHDSIHNSVGNPLGWRPAQGGLVAVTWTWATALPPDTSSACSGSLLLPGLAEAIPTRPKRLTLPSIPGVVRLRKVVRLTRCKLLWKRRQPRAS